MNGLKLSLLALLCSSGCGDHPAATGDARPLVLVASGDTAGWLVPCGCTSNQSGGLLRRGGYVKRLRTAADVVLVDVGGAPGGKSAYDRLKFEAILRGERAMDIAAHNIGAAEAALGAEALRQLAEQTGVPLVSANVRSADGQRLTEPLRIVEVAGWRIAVTGVLSQRMAGTLHATAPRQAVLDAVKTAGRYDWLVVLAYLPEDELRTLAESLPEADVVLGGPTGQPIAPKQIGPTLLGAATRQGKFLARLDAPRGTDAATNRWTGEIVELDGQWPDDRDQVANVARFREDLAKRDFTPADTSWGEPLPRSLPAEFSVASNESCRTCHPEDCRAWDKSKHARAWQSLSWQGAHVDPDCQRCHTTGYGQPGGFVSVRRSPALTNAGCESCHGPSLAHVRRPQTRTTHYAEAKNHCTGCHDQENSPHFAYAEYWQRIKHGDTPAVERKEGRR